MQKVLLAINAIKIDKPALDFAAFISRLTRSPLTGVFLENMVEEKRAIEDMLETRHALSTLEKPKSVVKQQLIEDNIKFFKECCKRNEISFRVHRDRSTPVRELIVESRFADLIIIDADTTFNAKYEGAPSGFVRDLLSSAECPVIVAPESFDGIDEIIFTYDGDRSSAFAIKQFTYLFPQFDEKKIKIVAIQETKCEPFQEKHKLLEWVSAHYSNVGLETLVGDERKKLFDYLFGRKNTFVVMGAFGRSQVSNLFSPSHAEQIIRFFTFPVFISHC